MAHELDMTAEVPMIYVGEVPWHGLGKKVPADLSTQEFLHLSQLDHEVVKRPLMAKVGPKKSDVIAIPDRFALVREHDNRVWDIVGKDWHPVQNREAFEFFSDFVDAGEMQMHTAGALFDGQVAWALAKVNESFTVFGKDQVDSYLLFSNPQKYGASIDIRFTPVRVVCNNTLTMAIRGASNLSARISHRQPFDAEAVKRTMGLAAKNLRRYEETAKFLGSKRYTDETVTEYIHRIFIPNWAPPVAGAEKGSGQRTSYSASAIIKLLETQPGAEFAPGTWWSAFNAVTHWYDHYSGNHRGIEDQERRVAANWNGPAATKKLAALDSALAYAATA